MRLTAPALVIAAAIFSMAQATATAPATTTAPAALPQCDDVTKLVKSIPANVWPTGTRETIVAEMTKIKEWSDKNAKGTKIDISAVRGSVKNVSAGHAEITLSYPANAKASILLRTPSDPGNTVECDQLSIVNNNGKYTITIATQ